jgi:hypothetical protein
MLSSTSISIVPVIYTGIIRSVDQLKELVRGPSAYNDQLREGIVIRMFHSSPGTNNTDTASGSTPARATTVVKTAAAATATAAALTVQQEESATGDSLDNWLVWRAKLVRSDFIAGNERWNRTSKLATNSLTEERSYA